MKKTKLKVSDFLNFRLSKKQSLFVTGGTTTTNDGNSNTNEDKDTPSKGSGAGGTIGIPPTPIDPVEG